MLYEAIIFVDGEPFAVGVEVPKLKARIFFNSRLYSKISEDLEVGVYFPSWEEVDRLISVAFGTKGTWETPLHFKWRISSVEEKEFKDEIGRTKVKEILFSGEVPSDEFLSDKISRGNSLALEAAVMLSKWRKNRIRGELRTEAIRKAKEAIRLGSKASKVLKEIFGRQRILWIFTGALTYAEECHSLAEEISEKADVIKLSTEAGEKIMKDLGKKVEREDPPFYKASKALIGEYDLVVIAPCTLNTLAKISSGISDSPATCAALHAMKGKYPVIILPVDITGEYFVPEKLEADPFFLAEMHSWILRGRGIEIARSLRELKEKIEKYLL